MANLKKLAPIMILLLTVFVCASFSFAEETSAVNINTASLEELTTLKGIGEKYAQKIIEYRENNEPFAKPEDVLNVKGIGLKTVSIVKNGKCHKQAYQQGSIEHPTQNRVSNTLTTILTPTAPELLSPEAECCCSQALIFHPPQSPPN